MWPASASQLGPKVQHSPLKKPNASEQNETENSDLSNYCLLIEFLSVRVAAKH